MNYFYLNERKEVQGPFTAGQMRRMVEDGTIGGHTLAAAEGGGNWQPLDSLTLVGGAPAVLWPCPQCHEMPEGAEQPAVCPHCGRHLHPGTDNLLQNAVYAFKQMFDFRGRAARREFWSFILYSYLAQYALAFVAILLGMTVVKVGHFDTAWFALMALVVLPGLVLIPPKLAVTVRRLHDRGHSGWWLPLVLVMAFAALRVIDIVENEPVQWYHDAIIAAGAIAYLGLIIQMMLPSKIPNPKSQILNLMYYYLNSKKTPTGPHSLEELTALLQQGAITLETLVAPVGGDAWKPLGTILTEASATGADLPPVPDVKGEVACPYCGREFTTERKGLPEQCPHCAAALHAQSRGLWRNFALALKRCLVFRGRSTRKEYWSTMLMCFVLYMLLVMSLIITLITLAVGDHIEPGTAIWVGAGAYVFICLSSILLFLGVYVRRLHDVGWSGWWVAVSMLLGFGLGFVNGQYAAIYDLAASPVWRYDVNSPRVHETAAQMAEEAELDLSDVSPALSRELHGCALDQLREEAIQSYNESQLQSMKNPWMLLGIVVHPLGILLFVLTLLDSKRGSNKYGPSAKYPLG